MQHFMTLVETAQICSSATTIKKIAGGGVLERVLQISAAARQDIP